MLQREPGTPLEHSSSHGTRVRSERGVQLPLLVIASEPLDGDPNWRALASGELVHVTAHLQLRSRIALSDPPAMRLTLADLGDRARASQSSAAQRPS